MPELIYATSNPAKVISLRRRLEPKGFTILHQHMNTPEPRLDSPTDTAIYKAIFAFQEFGQPVVALDAGFYVHRLNGFPRTNVKFGLETIGIDGLVKLATGSECWFRHSLAYHDGRNNTPATFSDNVNGIIAGRVRGQRQGWHWSDLCLIFIPYGSERTMGEMEETEWLALRNSGTFGVHYAEQFAGWYKENRATITIP